jgi:hypothetical protein
LTEFGRRAMARSLLSRKGLRRCNPFRFRTDYPSWAELMAWCWWQGVHVLGAAPSCYAAVIPQSPVVGKYSLLGI